MEKLLVGVTGMPGSGKSLVFDAAKENGYEAIIMGSVVREEAERRGLSPTPENLGRVMLGLRMTEGNSVVAKRCIQRIENSNSAKMVIDGVRSLDETEEFGRHFPEFKLVAVLSCPETRFKRIYHRGRSDDSGVWETFRERDLRELGVGLGNAIAMADYSIVNEGTIADAKEKILRVLRSVEEKWIS